MSKKGACSARGTSDSEGPSISAKDVLELSVPTVELKKLQSINLASLGTLIEVAKYVLKS